MKEMAKKDVVAKGIDESGTRIMQALIRTGDDRGLARFLGLDCSILTCWFCGRVGHIMNQCTVPKDKRLTREQRLAIATTKAFVSDDGEFILNVYPVEPKD